MSEIVLIRHAEPALRGVILGAADPVLSPLGHQQARLAGQTLASTARSAPLYVSPLRRALQTAAHLTEPWRPLVVLRDLCEISYGAWDGLTWDQIAARDPELAARKASDWMGTDIPGAEPWAAFEARVARAYQYIRRGPMPAVVVAHQGVNAVLWHLLTGSTQTEFHQAYAEVLAFPHKEYDASEPD